MTFSTTQGIVTTMASATQASRELFERAVRCIPGGVDSPVRAMRSVHRDWPVFIERGSGANVTDADGNSYVDWVQSWGALPLGHADREVLAAAREALDAGPTFGAPTRREVELAELVCSAMPSIERVRFTSSGTEATMSAARVARAATGRDTLVTFSGCYHGHADPFLATGGSGMATLSIPSSPGVPAAVAADTIVTTYNDIAATRKAIADSGRQIAAIFVEPVGANMGVVPPVPGFLQGLRTLADELSALLIFDEVITGFRVAWGGAQGLYDVKPDLTTLGKIIGGGMPVGAYGGRADLMDLVAPAGPVYQAGTLSGNPLAMAAGHATLTALRDRDAYATLEERGASLERSMLSAIASTGAHADVSRVGSLVTLFHLPGSLDHAPVNFVEAATLDTKAYARTHACALAGGHLLPPSAFEALFVSTAHSDDDIADLAVSLTSSLAEAPDTGTGS